MDLDQFLDETDEEEVRGVIEFLFTEDCRMITAQGGVAEQDIRNTITVLEARLGSTG